MTQVRRLFILLATLMPLLLPCMASGEIRLVGDWSYLWSQSESEDVDTDQSRDSSVRGFDQLYRLDVRKQLSPTLMFSGGALAEFDNLTSETGTGDETEISSQTVRPFIDAEFQNELFRFAGGYRESEIESSISDFETTRFLAQEYELRGEWQPTDLPSVEGAFLHSLRHDDPLTFEQRSDMFRLSSRYAWRDYDFTYNYLRSDELQQLRDTETVIQSHSGRARYVRTLMDNRINLNLRAQMEKTIVEFSGGGERIVPTVPKGTGFYIRKDTNPTQTLSDEDMTSVPPGTFNDINLAPGTIVEPVSLGLSFGDQTRADRVRIFLRTDSADPNLASPVQIDAVSHQFAWRVFVSNDQKTWIERSVTGTSYDPVENYFEIRFSPDADREFLKVTTTPLGPLALPGGEDIVVRDIQAFFPLPQSEGNRIDSLARIFNAGVGWTVTDRTRVGYDMAYQDLVVDAFDQQSRQWSNGVNLSHQFNQVFTGLVRLLRADQWRQGDHESVAYNYSAQVVARYLPTLTQSLTYSGSRSHEPEGSSVSNSIYLRTNAELYKGWDVSLDTGYNWQEAPDQGATSSLFLRFQNSIVPHRSISLIADYSARWIQQETQENYVDHIGRLRGHWSPTSALSLVGEVSYRDTDLGKFTDWEFGANWLPLRDGTLQANISYSEEGDSKDTWRRSLSPNLTWRMSKKATLSLTYSLGQLEDARRTADFHTIITNLRVFY